MPTTPEAVKERCFACNGRGRLYQTETRYELGVDGRDLIARDVVLSSRTCPICEGSGHVR